MRCPHCDGPLSPGGWNAAAAHSPYRTQICQTLELYECPSCRGSWLPVHGLGEALRQLVPRVFAAHGVAAQTLADALGRVQARWKDDHQPMRVVPQLLVSCPRCNAPMTKLRSQAQKFVLYDRCDACGGLWFDEGELERIIAALGAGLDQIGATLGVQERG